MQRCLGEFGRSAERQERALLLVAAFISAAAAVSVCIPSDSVWLRAAPGRGSTSCGAQFCRVCSRELRSRRGPQRLRQRTEQCMRATVWDLSVCGTATVVRGALMGCLCLQALSSAASAVLLLRRMHRRASARLLQAAGGAAAVAAALSLLAVFADEWLCGAPVPDASPGWAVGVLAASAASTCCAPLARRRLRAKGACDPDPKCRSFRWSMPARLQRRHAAESEGRELVPVSKAEPTEPSASPTAAPRRPPRWPRYLAAAASVFAAAGAGVGLAAANGGGEPESTEHVNYFNGVASSALCKQHGNADRPPLLRAGWCLLYAQSTAAVRAFELAEAECDTSCLPRLAATTAMVALPAPLSAGGFGDGQRPAAVEDVWRSAACGRGHNNDEARLYHSLRWWQKTKDGGAGDAAAWQAAAPALVGAPSVDVAALQALWLVAAAAARAQTPTASPEEQLRVASQVRSLLQEAATAERTLAARAPLHPGLLRVALIVSEDPLPVADRVMGAADAWTPPELIEACGEVYLRAGRLAAAVDALSTAVASADRMCEAEDAPVGCSEHVVRALLTAHGAAAAAGDDETRRMAAARLPDRFAAAVSCHDSWLAADALVRHFRLSSAGPRAPASVSAADDVFEWCRRLGHDHDGWQDAPPAAQALEAVLTAHASGNATAVVLAASAGIAAEDREGGRRVLQLPPVGSVGAAALLELSQGCGQEAECGVDAEQVVSLAEAGTRRAPGTPSALLLLAAAHLAAGRRGTADLWYSRCAAALSPSASWQLRSVLRSVVPPAVVPRPVWGNPRPRPGKFAPWRRDMQ
eukprot:TRINITY_DN14829_c0_g1_i1.p1 TRINITY_DN14829_c0_g1~~TRINITY_DN14829_c0_g1_i1.p1  ORF type:complete len:831 (+),score=179.08 TRINITY_DN14829_c0_g1_i1:59-2494(+)